MNGALRFVEAHEVDNKGMRTIGITEILSPDLKSRERVRLLLKNLLESPVRIEITNVLEDINTILEAVSRTQTRAKVIPSRISERSFRNVDELVKYLKAA